MKEYTDSQIATRVSIISIILNVVLSCMKLFVGIFAHSAAMISDAVHSVFDVFDTFIVILGVNLSARKPDRLHPYGHERFECVTSIILSIILFTTGLGIGISGLEKIIGKHSSALTIPGAFALIVAIVSILLKECMYLFTRSVAKSIDSGALMTDAWHHHSDALASLGTFAGILGARLGFPILDPLTSIIICLFIGKASFGVFKDGIDKMIDKSCDDKTLSSMRELICSQTGVLHIDLLQTRLFGSKIYVDIEITADGHLTLIDAHKIAEQVHTSIETQFPTVKHCMVHVNPDSEKEH
ncbi:MAG: cation diffusion facilitator family transporter [Lachnospiraceae bacterium]